MPANPIKLTVSNTHSYIRHKQTHTCSRIHSTLSWFLLLSTSSFLPQTVRLTGTVSVTNFSLWLSSYSLAAKLQVTLSTDPFLLNSSEFGGWLEPVRGAKTKRLGERELDRRGWQRKQTQSVLFLTLLTTLTREDKESGRLVEHINAARETRLYPCVLYAVCSGLPGCCGGWPGAAAITAPPSAICSTLQQLLPGYLLSSPPLQPTFYSSSSFGSSPPSHPLDFSPQTRSTLKSSSHGCPSALMPRFSPHTCSFLFPPINLICLFILKRIPAFDLMSFIGVRFNSLYISDAPVKY